MVQFIKKYKTQLKIGLLFMVLAFLGQFIYHTDIDVIIDYLKKMPYTFVGVIGFSLAAYTSATLAWQLCMGAEGKKTSLPHLFMIRHVGEMLSVFNPTSVIAGETLKAHYLAKKGISSQISISSILMSRVLIILSALLLILLSATYLVFNAMSGDQHISLVLIAIVVMISFGYLLARFLLHSKLYLFKTIKKLQTRFGDKYFSNKLCTSIKEINVASHEFYIKNKGKFILAFILSFVHWIFGAAEFYLVLKVMNIDISLINAVAIEMGVILFKTIGAVIPGQVGVEEYANKVMLGAVGIASNEIWLVVSIMRRARQLFWVGVAALFYWMIGKQTDIRTSQT